MKSIFGLNKKNQIDQSNAAAQLDNAGEIELAPGLCNLYSPQIIQKVHVRDILDVLADTGRLTVQQVSQIRQEKQQKRTGDLEQFAVKNGVGRDDVLMAKAQLYGFEFRHITPDMVDRQVFDKLEPSYIKNNRIMPIAVRQGVLVVATSEPANVFAIDDVKRQTGMNTEVVVCSPDDIDAVCNEFDDNKLDYNVDEIMSDMAEIEVVKDQEEDIGDLEKSAGESPVIKFVNFLLTNALNEGASDIHIEPKEKTTKIRYRIDGILFDSMQSPVKMHPAIISRIKIMANLDISERRLPQDGKIAVRAAGRGIDLRISVLPTSRGEKVVIRILDSKSIMVGLEQCGMEPETLKSFREQIELPNGILLVTGPTGSGKSTTLYSALCQMDGNKMNISTVEDPVEYDLEFCNQVQANEKVGLTFALALRSLLRQDPDIIMIGEIRDNETARIAVQAALTGHLVLSTLHTNDAPSSISRLVNIGIEPYLLSASMNAVLAQRLVRRICNNCKEPYKLPENMLKYTESAGVNPSELMHGAGCDHCRQSGYSGRAGIFELLVVDEIFRDLINKDSSVSNMRKAFNENGCLTLFSDGIRKVKKGITTMEEVLRVTQVYGQNENEAFVEDVTGLPVQAGLNENGSQNSVGGDELKNPTDSVSPEMPAAVTKQD